MGVTTEGWYARSAKRVVRPGLDMLLCIADVMKRVETPWSDGDAEIARPDNARPCSKHQVKQRLNRGTE